MHFGIDFGAKTAGTTAVCFNEGSLLKIVQTAKGQDADLVLENLITLLQPELIMIDAPLSLPAAYYGEGDDFFYRQCDRNLQAMSPMFLGGLTARAMRLKKHAASIGIQMYETYPKQIAKSMNVYPQHHQQAMEEVCKATQMTLECFPQSKHAMDAVFAWFAGWRFVQQLAVQSGLPSEGLIWY